MKDSASTQIGSGANLVVSSFSDSVSELLQNRLLNPPRHPGYLGKLENFDVLSIIGRGGMGIVFQARDSKNGDLVALKVLRPEFAIEPRIVRRFIREARHLQKMAHANIVPVILVSENSEAPYLVMPYYASRSLEQMLQPGTPLDPRITLSFARQLASALDLIHSKGIVHRDIKPGNILIESPACIRLGDFGLARSLFNDSMIDIDAIKPEGTAAYMSPAVASGKAEDTRCDIYGFGAVLYQLLTGMPPYAGKTPAEILEKIRSGPPEPIQKLNPSADPGLAAIAERAMARRHRDRYASMADVLEDLDAVAANRSIRSWTPARKRSILTLAAGALGIAVLLLGGILLWQSKPARLVLLKSEPLPKPFLEWRKFIPAHMDADGGPDLVYLEGNAMGIIHSTGEHRPPLKIDGIDTQEPMIVTLACDVNKDSLDELFVSWSESTNAHVAVVKEGRWMAREFVFSGPLYKHPQFGISPVVAIASHAQDLNGDGHLELLATIVRAWGDTNEPSSWPRGVCCFDYSSGKQKWFFETAPFVTSVTSADLDGDGAKEVILGSNSPENGKKMADGTDDSHTYIYALTHQGKLLWRTEMGPRYSEAHVLGTSANGSGGRDVFVIMNSERSYSDAGIVHRLSNTGAVLASYSAGMSIEGYAFLDSSNSNRAGIVIADRDGNLHLLSSDLAAICKTRLVANKFDWVETSILGLHSFPGLKGTQLLLHVALLEDKTAMKPYTGDDRNEPLKQILHENELVIVNAEDLRVVARTPTAENAVYNRFHADVLEPHRGGQSVIRTVFRDLRYYTLSRH